ncbi:MAG: hypothetical protein HUU02_09170 [Bacteroidetes bacterium]|nr:hypothetical protein [Bacteroidota bacterium]
MSFNKCIITVFTLLLLAVPAAAQLAGAPGAFTRMGFGARGMGMGNALASVRTGENSGIYNPAATALLKRSTASASYGILTLDRGLNTLFYSQPIDTNAGIALHVLNSGTSGIDGRDIDGFHTEMYSVSENQFSLSFGLRIRSITVGLTTKLYYYSLFEELSSTAVGFDVGVIYPLGKQWTLAAVFRDLNTKYKWDTNKLYGQLGNSTTEKFPTRQTVGITYQFEDASGLLSFELEKSSLSTIMLRMGGEYTPVEYLTLRAGLDGWETEDKSSAHPSFGFSLRTPYTDWRPTIHYAYVLEPYGLFSMHVISVSLTLGELQ